MSLRISLTCCSGMAIIIGSTVAVTLALTWGGLVFPWDSAHVLAPLIIGAIGIVAFFIAERRWLGGRTARTAVPCDLSPYAYEHLGP